MAGKSTFGGSIKLTGESEYQKALKSINSNLAVLSSEMKVVASSFNKNEDSISSLNAKNEILNKKLTEQNKVLAEAKKMLNEAKTSTDSNATTVKKWETALNNAQAEVNKTTREISNNEKTLNDLEKANVDNTKELKNFSDAEEKAGKSSLSLGDIIKGNLISDAIIGGIKSLGRAMSNFASNFKEWSDMADALKEQEMKVTQVMKNTTGASDEEIQSLIDLTAAKEKLGVVSQETQLAGLQELGTYVENKESLEAMLPVMNDMIAQQYGIGASMESASGIATMMGKVLGNGQVDALSRLGYKFDEAQEQVLKFGTEEEKVKVLSEVIEQSVGGMNEALALTNAGKIEIATSYIDDMKKSVGELATEMKGKIVGEFLPEIKELSDALVEMVNGDISIEDGMTKMTDVLQSGIEKLVENIPAVLEVGVQIISKILQGIINSLPQILPAVVQVIMTLVTNLTQMLPQILQAGISILLELINGISQSLPELIPIMVKVIMDMVNVLLDNIDEIIECGIELLVALTEGLMNALPELISRLPEIIIKITSKLIELSPQLLSAALRIILALAEGLIKYIPEMISRIPEIIKSMVNALKNGVQDFKNIGSNLLKGIWEGISDTKDWLVNKVKSIGSTITSAIKGVFGIHSPSRVFKDEIGKNLALGLGEGFENEMVNVNKEIQGALPTDFDLSSNVNLNNSLSNANSSMDNNYNSMVNAFKQALGEMKIQLNDEVAGNFVESTIERVIYA